MARIAGVTIPNNKRIVIALTYIYGIGNVTAQNIIKETGIDPNTRTQNLTDGEVAKVRTAIEKGVKVEGELRREVMSHRKRLADTGSYRGSRHAKKLPCRGQRTKTNSRTIRANVRRTAGSGRVKTGQKT